MATTAALPGRGGGVASGACRQRPALGPACVQTAAHVGFVALGVGRGSPPGTRAPYESGLQLVRCQLNTLLLGGEPESG